jgi:hypothetical protein
MVPESASIFLTIRLGSVVSVRNKTLVRQKKPISRRTFLWSRVKKPADVKKTNKNRTRHPAPSE